MTAITARGYRGNLLVEAWYGDWWLALCGPARQWWAIPPVGSPLRSLGPADSVEAAAELVSNVEEVTI